MSEWVRLCAVGEAPKPGEVMEAEAKGVQVCLANVNGRLAALEQYLSASRRAAGTGMD